jgi:hypothetical protein
MHEADARGGPLDVQKHILDPAAPGSDHAVGPMCMCGRPTAAAAAVGMGAKHEAVQPPPHFGWLSHAGGAGHLQRDTTRHDTTGQDNDLNIGKKQSYNPQSFQRCDPRYLFSCEYTPHVLSVLTLV